MITSDLIFMKEALGYGFVDYCNYESMEASQFSDDLEKFSKIVSEKLNNLADFEKYVLLEYITSKESQRDTSRKRISGRKNKPNIRRLYNDK